ncbi:MAG: RNA degradosome polyphosphate kinase [Saccharofermentanaceae bacterium]|nr:RNA degradosome polyphosphate kinase [Saccharofermentanaceae bacterium]HAU50849.1 RNA degradosome polyphosphate kinase [Clostridiales bacterium]
MSTKKEINSKKETNAKKETGSKKEKKEKKLQGVSTEVARSAMDNADIESDSTRYFNRELSWLEFNNRILFESRDTKNPLLERLKFLSITASNMDEFYIVRVASLRDLLSVKYDELDISGRTVKQQLSEIDEKARAQMALMYSTYTRSLVPSLKNHNIFISDYRDLDDHAKEVCDDYFRSTLYPILTPMAVDASRPFPLIYNRQLNLCVLIDETEEEKQARLAKQEKKGKVIDPEYRFATLQVPTVVPRLFEMHLSTGICFVPIEGIIQANLSSLFIGSSVLASGFYRVMRNADLDIDEDEAEDLLKEIEEQVRKRRFGEIIRMEINEDLDPRLLKLLTTSLKISKKDVFPVGGPIDLTFLMKVVGKISDDFPDLCYHSFRPAKPKMFPEGVNIFDAIRAKDRLVHHPYESFDPVVEFVRQAAEDPKVLAIKQTLYRVSSSSPIIKSLAEAAQNGKQVMVLVELKARFDEENNINWAKMLEKAGCHVIYGLVGLKTHSKITLVVRDEEDGIRRYLHLATGNYNDITARIYTDIGLFTASETFGVDASEFFNTLSGFSDPPEWKRLIPAPTKMKKYFLEKISQEAKNARKGKKSRIIAKMNSLVDANIIDALYDASCAGVKIDLIVRGICCLRPGVPGLSENITVRSITGRFLEHSRIYYFYNEGQEDVYLSSADWMPRNLIRRVELLFPVEDPDCKARVMEVLDVELEDTVRSHFLDSDGSYHKLDLRGKKKLDSQEELQQN